MRNKLEKTRNHYKELYELEMDPKTSDKTFEKAKKKIAQSAAIVINGLDPEMDRWDNTRISDVGRDVMDMLKEDELNKIFDESIEILSGVDGTIDGLLGEIGPEDISASGVIKFAINHLSKTPAKLIKARKHRTFYRIGKKFKKAKDYNEIIPKLWGKQISDKEVERAKLYSSYIQKLWESERILR